MIVRIIGSHAIALPVLALLLLLAACGRPGQENASDESAREHAVLTAANLGEQVVLPTRDYLQLPRYANANRELGERLVMQCRACHSFQRGGPTLIGPNLHGFFGRRAGSGGGYAYSPVLREADFIWTPEALDAWLAQPAAFLPGNRMVYAGLSEQADRDAAIAALLRLTTASAETD